MVILGGYGDGGVRDYRAGRPRPYKVGVCVTFSHPAPFNPPYGGGLGWGFFSSISFLYKFFDCAAELVGA